MTARIFRYPSTYSFPLNSSGPKFVRLFFYPASYLGLNKSHASFSVTTGRYTLLRNFKPSLTADALELPYLIMEFCINEVENLLTITFTPSTQVSSDAYAFVNGIEICSMPNHFYTHDGHVPTPLVGQKSIFYTDNSTALQMLFRLNVGGNNISPQDDTGMFRDWFADKSYIFGAAYGVTVFNPNITIKYTRQLPSYAAPASIYSTARSMGPSKLVNRNYNLSWLLPVDSRFHYLVRLHFCEFQPEIRKPNQKVFHIFINNQTAESHADVIAWSGGNGIPVYKDYIVYMEHKDLWIKLQPTIESNSMYEDAILNGMEVFKLSDSKNNLAGPTPTVQTGLAEPSSEHSPPESSSRRSEIAVVLGGAAVVFILLGLLISSTSGLREAKREKEQLSSKPTDVICRHFSFAEIEAATRGFDESLLLVTGGFGKVYKGYIDNGATVVAIKRANPMSKQGRHDCAKICIGTLRDHLYGTEKPPLPWKQRLKICIGPARGLHYLHTGAKYTIIHRDIKTTNILLGEMLEAKVADFGLSKVGPTSGSRSHVSTRVKGTFGYLDPEYYRLRRLTEKSDVYSFGIVLFEVLCARGAVDIKAEEESEVGLAGWAVRCLERGTLHEMVDPYLKGTISPECFLKFTQVAKNCLAAAGINPPPMVDVLQNLELALQLQESSCSDR
uniref:Protein kinase domain-containing protein n=1 Tax=Nelumbo nucifera TaxID=4432 RepID=A0A822YWH3_NELNU|nr:TPA_asm: hypothetical protein HUJ06_005746 [Nelumbo nucifera]